ncbi:major facilitator superfamily domain-containing protein [Lipomyces japonicus]|uniref:major facilitator superfamily domain-containing protein n=1 Tax=Lipomyces japonicus TaxID=56871 RepID=UPI0034CE21E1
MIPVNSGEITIEDYEEIDDDIDEKQLLPPIIDPEARPVQFKSNFHEAICILILTMSTAMNTASQGAVQIAVPSLARYFAISGGNLSWIVSSFSLMSGATILLFSSMADALGRRRLVLASYSLFTIWALAGSFTTHHIVFDVARGMQGCAAAACPSASVGILGTLYRSGRRKNTVMAVFCAGAPLGAFFGQVTGGVCTQYINWRSMFYFLSIIYFLFTILVFFFVPEDGINDNVKLSIKEVGIRIGGLDLFGAFLSILACVLIVFSASHASSSSKGWATPSVLIIFAIAVVVLAAFIWWETRVSNPLMPMRIWKAPGFGLCMALMFFSFMAFTGVLTYYTSLYFENILDASPIQTTVYFIPQTVASLIALSIVSRILHIVPGRFLLIVSQLCNMAATLLWALRPIDISYWAMSFPAICLCVIAADFAYNVVNLHTVSAVPANEQSAAAGIFYTISHIAGSIGISFSSSVASGILRKEMVESTVDVAKDVLAKAYAGAFWVGVACSAVGMACACFVKVGIQGIHGSDILDYDDDQIRSSTSIATSVSFFDDADNDAEECSRLIISNSKVMCYKSLEA